jgi:hypothetical protein
MALVQQMLGTPINVSKLIPVLAIFIVTAARVLCFRYHATKDLHI